MVVADAAGEVVLLDHLAHVGEDLVGSGDRLAAPRLELVAEGVQVAVGTDARVRVRDPRPAETGLGVEHRERRVGQASRQVDGGADAGDARAHDQDIEVLVGALAHGRTPVVGAQAPR